LLSNRVVKYVVLRGKSRQLLSSPTRLRFNRNRASPPKPAAAKALKQQFLAADALIFVSPEYNSSVTPLMKNFIDWVSRAESHDETPLAAYKGKVAGLLAASPGALGGIRGLVHLRAILGNIGVLVVPKQFALGSAYGKFDESGKPVDSSVRDGVRPVVAEVLSVASKLHG
jgi:NAD(P)H-dependent FMN reductase